MKRIQVVPGGRLSLQKHYHRAEHWVVVRGTAEVTIDDRVVLVHENEAVYLRSARCTGWPIREDPAGADRGPGRSYTGEDDIIRVEDIYGR